MARSALNALDALDFLGVDSFLYLNGEASGGAVDGGVADGAQASADIPARAGLDLAISAPDGPPATEGPAEHRLALARDWDAPRQHAAPGTGDAAILDHGAGHGLGWLRHELRGDSVETAAAAAVIADYRSGSFNGEDGFDIHIRFNGTDWTPELQQAFIRAADYFTGGTAETHASNPGVIIGDIGDGAGRLDRFVSRFVDDLRVTAELTPIDGTGGTLGQAGPQFFWSSEVLTSLGKMEFDTADAEAYVAKGLWDDVVTHEMMHVLGFGSAWEIGRDLVDEFQYTGQAALDAFRDAQGDDGLTFIPVEDDGGRGTAGAHWDEQALGNELMTGFINDDGDPATEDDNFLSEFSVMALADLGYQVEYHDYPYDEAATA